VSDQGIFLVHRDNTALELPRRRIYPTSIDVGLFLGRFPEIWVSRYLQRNGMFFSIGLQQQQFLLFPRSRGEALETSFNSLPLLMPGAALGYRFRPVFHPENEGDKNYLPRPYLSLALFLRCNYEKKSFDDFSPFSVTFSAGYDWAMPFKIHLFIELGAAFYILGEDYKNSRSKGTGDQGFIQQVLNGAAYFEFPSFRAGLKIPLPF
jgi:hypothetical protein